MAFKHIAGLAVTAALMSTQVQAKTEIEWWHAMGGALGKKVNEIADNFNASQSECEIKPVYKGTYAETMTGAIAAFRAKEQPAIVQVFEVGTATMMGAKKAVYPVYELMAEVINKLNIEPELMLFSSFDQSALFTIKQHLPHVRRGQLWETIPSNHAVVLTELDAFSVHCNYRFLTEEKAKAVKRLGYQLYCYTPNQPELVEDHWLWGVDMMITDTPHRYLASK